MNTAEALAILDAELSLFRCCSYQQLAAMVNAPTACVEKVGPSGAVYQIEVSAFWDAHPGGAVRLWVTADDGGIRAWFPLTRTFIMAPDGSLIGE